jgi:ethanolamine permease
MQYREADSAYLESRSLRRHARVPHLWALGVGAVISGDFFGWNFGLAEGGFGGMLAALCVMTLLFAGLCSSIAEMSPALPHAGGAYSFARTSMGPWAGYITGLAENMEYILTPAVIVVGLGGYLGAIFGTPPALAPLWWVVCYAAFVGFNLAGVELSFAVSKWITFGALFALIVFFVAATPRFDLHGWALGTTGWLPNGWSGIGRSLPFALWVYLGIEQLPLAAEEAHEPTRDMPRALWLAFATLVLFAFPTVILNAGVEPGAAIVAKSDEPLLLALRTIFGPYALAKAMALIACFGLAASFHSIIYAYGRQIFSLSRAGYFPVWLSVTNGKRQTPARALIVGAVMGLGAALAIQIAGQKSPVGAVLLNMAVFGAVISYVLQMLSFILLRTRYSRLHRPYRSPLGIAGALLAAGIAIATFIALLLNPDYRWGVAGAAVWFALGLLWFALKGRHNLVLAPEEEFARNATDTRL